MSIFLSLLHCIGMEFSKCEFPCCEVSFSLALSSCHQGPLHHFLNVKRFTKLQS